MKSVWGKISLPLAKLMLPQVVGHAPFLSGLASRLAGPSLERGSTGCPGRLTLLVLVPPCLMWVAWPRGPPFAASAMDRPLINQVRLCSMFASPSDRICLPRSVAKRRSALVWISTRSRAESGIAWTAVLTAALPTATWKLTPAP